MAKLDFCAEIAASGNFKYVLLWIKDGENEYPLVCGYHMERHALIVKAASENLFDTMGIHKSEIRVAGGGRIKRDANEITLFGDSIDFGQADHSLAAQLLQSQYPNLKVTIDLDY